MPADRRRERHEALAALFEADGAALDALLVTSRPNIRYLTGFSGDSSHLVLMRDRGTSGGYPKIATDPGDRSAALRAGAGGSGRRGPRRDRRGERVGPAL